jgi:hypothetical protein
MASLSPNQASQRGFGAGPTGQDNTPLSTLNLDFLRTLNEKKTTRGPLSAVITRKDVSN